MQCIRGAAAVEPGHSPSEAARHGRCACFRSGSDKRSLVRWCGRARRVVARLSTARSVGLDPALLLLGQYSVLLVLLQTTRLNLDGIIIVETKKYILKRGAKSLGFGFLSFSLAFISYVFVMGVAPTGLDAEIIRGIGLAVTLGYFNYQKKEN